MKLPLRARERLASAARRADSRWFADDSPRFADHLRYGTILVALWLSLEVDLRYADLPKGAQVSVLGLVVPIACWSSKALLVGTKILLWTGSIAWLLGRHRPLAAWTTTLGMLLLGSIYWENLPWFRHKFITPFWILLLLSAAEHRPRLPPGWLREGAVLVLAAFYGGAGLAKIHGSGLRWADGVGLQLWMLRLGDRGSLVRDWLVASSSAAQVLATALLLLEFAVLLAPLVPRTRRALGLLLLGLHLGIDLCLHIDFRPQMLLVALILLPRDLAIPRPRPASDGVEGPDRLDRVVLLEGRDDHDARFLGLPRRFRASSARPSTTSPSRRSPRSRAATARACWRSTSSS